MDWERVNVWTNALYAMIQSLSIANRLQFGNLTKVHDYVVEAGDWITPDCSYESSLLAQGFGKRKITFRRDPNKHFESIVLQVSRMAVQDLTVILDEMLDETLKARGLKSAQYPQSKIEQLAKFLRPEQNWAKVGCLELIAVRNAITHSSARWNKRSIDIVAPYLAVTPKAGEEVKVGISMLFRYRKAMRTFLNEVAPK